MTLNTQRVSCVQSYQIGGFWQNAIACEPVSCLQPPPAVPTNAYRDIIYSANTTSNQRYQV